MSTQIKYRRGTEADHENFTGAAGEITVNTTNNSLRVHDGVTKGGKPIGGEFSSVAAAAASAVPEGTRVRTENYYDGISGGGATYTARPATYTPKPGDIACTNGTYLELEIEAVNDIRKWGARGDAVLPEFNEAGDSGTDNYQFLLGAYDRLGKAEVNHITESAILDLAGGSYLISSTINLTKAKHNGVLTRNGVIAASPAFSGATNDPLVKVGTGSSGADQVWRVGFEQVTFSGRRRASGILFDGVQKCFATNCIAIDFASYGFSTETKTGGLILTGCYAYEYEFSDTRNNIYSNRTASAYLMNTADWIMEGCVGAVSKHGFKGTKGYNWQMNACHFWVGITDVGGNIPLVLLDGIRSGAITNLYLDEGIIQMRGYFDYIINGVLAAQGTYGSTTRVFDLIATSANETARNLIIDNVKSDRFISDLIKYSTEGSGSWDRPKHMLGLMTNGGTNTSQSQPHANIEVTRQKGYLYQYSNYDDAEFDDTVVNAGQQFAAVGTSYNKGIGIVSYAESDAGRPPMFVSAVSPSGTVGVHGAQCALDRELGAFWALGTDGTNFGDGGKVFKGGAGVRVFANSNHTPSDLAARVEIWGTRAGNNSPTNLLTISDFSKVIRNGSGSPEGVVTGSPGDVYTNNLGGVGTTLYVKETGFNTNTGWVAK